MFKNPITRKLKNLFYYIFIWLLISAFYALLLWYFYDVNYSIAIIDALIINALLSGIGLTLWYPSKYIFNEGIPVLKIISLHFFAGIIFALICISLSYFITNYILSGFNYPDLFYKTLSLRAVYGVLSYYLITSFYYIIIYYQNLQEKSSREVELQNLITQAEIRSLKFQINPHFIFNSLNSMSALTSIDPIKAREMILKLADFLRYTLSNNDKQKNKLKDEIKNIRLYLDIEKIRFEDKFDFEENINVECCDVYVPNMILQPLFENAIKHAVYESLEKIILKMECKRENDILIISLTNNYEKGSIVKKGAGVGLENIRKRLELIYNAQNLLEVKKDEGIFKVILYIPIEK
ncbi:MAG: sensor histidine kinase [Syntrophothermus sp.]